MKIIVCVLCTCTMSVFLNKANILHFQQEMLSEEPQEPHVYIYTYYHILSVDITHSHSDLVGKLLAVWLFNFSIFQKP